MNFVKWASNVLDSVDSQASTTVQKIITANENNNNSIAAAATPAKQSIQQQQQQQYNNNHTDNNNNDNPSINIDIDRTPTINSRIKSTTKPVRSTSGLNLKSKLSAVPLDNDNNNNNTNTESIPAAAAAAADNNNINELLKFENNNNSNNTATTNIQAESNSAPLLGDNQSVIDSNTNNNIIAPVSVPEAISVPITINPAPIPNTKTTKTNSTAKLSTIDSASSSATVPPLPTDIQSLQDEIQSLRQVWNETRSQLTKAKQLLISHDENNKQKLIQLEQQYSTEIDSLTVQHNKELTELRTVIANNQREFESALTAKSQFVQSNQSQLDSVHQQLNNYQTETQRLQSRIELLETDRIELLELQQSQLLQHQQQLQQLRIEEQNRLSLLESEMKLNSRTLQSFQHRDTTLESNNLEYITALANLQRSLEDKSRQYERLQAEKRWIETDSLALNEQIQSIKLQYESQLQQQQSIQQQQKQKLELLTSELLQYKSESNELQSKLTISQSTITELQFKLTTDSLSEHHSQRLLDYENRLKSIAEHLLTKTATIERLTAEKTALKLQLEQNELRLFNSERQLNLLKERNISMGDNELVAAVEQDIESGNINNSNNSNSINNNSNNNNNSSTIRRFNNNNNNRNNPIGSLTNSSILSNQSSTVGKTLTFFNSIGFQSGLVLRRYPSARLAFGFYVLLIHLWVIFVLYHFFNHSGTGPGIGLTEDLTPQRLGIKLPNNKN